MFSTTSQLIVEKTRISSPGVKSGTRGVALGTRMCTDETHEFDFTIERTSKGEGQNLFVGVITRADASDQGRCSAWAYNCCYAFFDPIRLNATSLEETVLDDKGHDLTRERMGDAGSVLCWRIESGRLYFRVQHHMYEQEDIDRLLLSSRHTRKQIEGKLWVDTGIALPEEVELFVSTAAKGDTVWLSRYRGSAAQEFELWDEMSSLLQGKRKPAAPKRTSTKQLKDTKSSLACLPLSNVGSFRSCALSCIRSDQLPCIAE